MQLKCVLSSTPLPCYSSTCNRAFFFPGSDSLGPAAFNLPKGEGHEESHFLNKGVIKKKTMKNKKLITIIIMMKATQLSWVSSSYIPRDRSAPRSPPKCKAERLGMLGQVTQGAREIRGWGEGQGGFPQRQKTKGQGRRTGSENKLATNPPTT